MLASSARPTPKWGWQTELVEPSPANRNSNAQPLPPVLKAPTAVATPVLPAEPTVSGPPVHPLSAVVLAAVDGLWGLADWAVVDWVITIPLSFVSVAVPTFCVQKFLRKDTTGRAVAVALVLGVLAAVPTPITGTPIGLAILGWAGINRFRGKDRG